MFLRIGAVLFVAATLVALACSEGNDKKADCHTIGWHVQLDNCHFFADCRSGEYDLDCTGAQDGAQPCLCLEDGAQVSEVDYDYEAFCAQPEGMTDQEMATAALENVNDACGWDLDF